MYDRSEYTVTDSGIDEYGGVWVTAVGPDYRIARRLCAAHSRKHNYGQWVSGGASFMDAGKRVEVNTRYHPGKR
ncbi:hypothetical protein SEA_PATELGO_269 [Streptomyces phage Patelgo]|nr:hypothetical protein SEA_PATELGO_269 [Streptomyces phage Patelgo]